MKLLVANHIEILLIEDNHFKAKTVEEQLEKRLDQLSFQITRAQNYEEALNHLNQKVFDVAIVDLLLPGMGQDPSTHASKALIIAMLDKTFVQPPYIIGLTEFAETAEEEKDFFLENMVQLETYDPVDRSWADRISKKLMYLSKVIKASSMYVKGSFNYDVVIIVAKYDTEYLPIKKQIKWVVKLEDGHPFFSKNKHCTGTVELQPNTHIKLLLICLDTMGIAASASLTTQVAIVCRPRVVSMLGMCCGFQESVDPSKLGDIVVAKECELWDEGKYDEIYEKQRGFKYRPQPIQASNKIKQIAESVRTTKGNSISTKISKRAFFRRARENDTFSNDVNEKPSIKVGKILSGLNVVSDTEKINLVLDRAPNAIALEMEIYGVYKAIEALENNSSEFIAIKGVADFGHKKDGGKFDPVQSVATQASWFFFVEILKDFFQELD